MPLQQHILFREHLKLLSLLTLLVDRECSVISYQVLFFVELQDSKSFYQRLCTHMNFMLILFRNSGSKSVSCNRKPLDIFFWWTQFSFVCCGAMEQCRCLWRELELALGKVPTHWRRSSHSSSLFFTRWHSFQLFLPLIGTNSLVMKMPPLVRVSKTRHCGFMLHATRLTQREFKVAKGSATEILCNAEWKLATA